MNKQKLIEKYTREANNLNHNILHELNKDAWNGPTDYKLVEYSKGQLSIIREIVHILKDEYEYLDNLPIQLRLDYKLGEPLRK